MRSIVVLALVVGCNQLEGVKGDGTVKDETRQVVPFTTIEIDGAIHGYITAGGAQSVQLRSDGNIVPLIATDVSDGRLHVHPTKRIAPTTGPVATIAAPRIAGLFVSGASIVEMKGVAGEAFGLEVSGAAHVALVGSAEKLTIQSSGAAIVDASGVTAGDVTVMSSGAGSVDVSARGVLEVDISGAAKVRYHGTPSDIHKEISGAGSLDQAP